jgi:hypothetical protein
MWIGSGVYPMSKDYFLSALYAHQAWTPQTYSPLEMIDLILRDNQGNLAQVWGYGRGYAPSTIAEWDYALDEIGVQIPPPDWEKGTNLRKQDTPELLKYRDRQGAGALRFIREAAKKGLYTLFIYVDARKQWSSQFQKAGGKYYLGYDFGERYSFGISEHNLKGKKLEELNLKVLADDLVERVRKHVDQRHADGWGNVMATSTNFFIDYEIAAGTDVPLIEDFAFEHLNMASALSRGLYRQYRLPIWGSHMAHEHYSWIPNASEFKFFLLKAGMYQKYMAGCKIIINESGNWFVEASLCEDSPKHDFPFVPLKQEEVSWGGHLPPKFSPYIAEARKQYHKIDYTGEIPRKYRREISDFYDFVKANGTPSGQPESTIAIAKGNLDLCNHRYSPNAAVAGAFSLADKNPAWFEGAPERGWEIVKETFYPRPAVLGDYQNSFLSGNPFGMVDIVSFALDNIDAAFLNANYKALLFAGWNTASVKQYEILTEYVKNGGTLFISIPHLSTNASRNYGDYGVDELVHGGDFSALCGVKVKGRGRRIYWATPPRGSEELGVKYPRRFGILQNCLGEIEVIDPAVEALIVDDEAAEPLLLRRRLGKGTVYFLNSWGYPGALNEDFGPGSRSNSPGLIGTIYRHIAREARGNVWISDDGREPGDECQRITYSYFPEDGTVCLLNIDSRSPRAVFLHHFGQVERLELTPGEFKTLKVNRRKNGE